MHLQAHRPYTHDQCSHRVREYHSYFTTSIIEAHYAHQKKIQMLHKRRNICYTNHGHVTTIQLLALGHVDNKMIAQFGEFLLQMYMYKQMIIKTVYTVLIFTRWMLLLKVLLTINNNIYCCRYQTSDVITSCTLIVPCLVPVYIR